jgi:pyrophosphatase PpaX
MLNKRLKITLKGLDGMKVKVQGLLIDLDGTIVDSREAYIEAFKKAAKIFRPGEFNHEELALKIPKRLELNQPISDLIPGINVENFLKAYLEAYYASTRKFIKPFPNVSKTLGILSEKAKLALVTMRHVSRENVREELEKLGLAKHFNYILTALDTPFPKPSPEALKKCASELNVEIRKCAVVGDSVADVRAGKNAGAKTVAVLSGLFTRKELESECPDLILESIERLPAFVEPYF